MLNTFNECRSLKSIFIPKGVTRIGDDFYSENGFQYCGSLESIVVEEGNTVYTSSNGANAIIEIESNKLILGCMNTIIPESVTRINSYAFWGCSGLTSITIPESVTLIDSYAFCACYGLTSITIPESVTHIGDYAFASCRSLTSVTIPNFVTYIGMYAFAYCENLEEMLVGMKSPSNTPVGSYVFDNCNLANATLYVPKGSGNQYRGSGIWSQFGEIIESDHIPSRDDYITVDDMTSCPGVSAECSIGLTNKTTDLTSYRFYLTLPTGISLANAADGKFMVTTTDRYEDEKQRLTVVQLADGSYRVSCNSSSNGLITGNEGPILNMMLTTDASVLPGSYKASVYDAVAARTDQSQVFMRGATFNIEVVAEPVIPGVDTRMVLDEDATTAPTDAEGVDVRVIRTIAADRWSTICLPFAMSADQVQTAFGNDVQLGDFTGYTYNSDEDKITVNFSNVTAIEANHPYIIKVSAAVTEFTVDGVDVNPVDDPRVTFRASNKKLKDFVGTYVADFDFYNDAKHTPLFLSGNQFWYATEATKHLKAFRAYFDFADMLSEVDAARIAISFGDATAIKDVRMCDDDRYYNLSGQQVETPTKGVYVKNGKKVIVK